MLSRIAESLYWVGRYMERAEDMARILDVHVHRLLEDPAVEEGVACAALLAAMGLAPGDGDVDVAEVTRVLGLDPDSPASIVRWVGNAHQNARGARDAMSAEMWECLNATQHSLSVQAERALEVGPHAFFQYVKERAAIMAGLADATMSRDDGWRFLVLGRSLERVDMTTRLLLARFREPSGPAGWTTTLRSCSAHEAFLRTYRRGVEPALVVEFLVLDRLFPRSCIHALGVAEQCLAELDPDAGRVGVDDEARRLLGRARTQLEFQRVGELLGDLSGYLHHLQVTCAEAGDAVARRFFAQSGLLAWAHAADEPAGWSEHLRVQR
ncbi:MAG TPA: alpha-E domain-containing protein [Acidimicrobiales bacterium]|nr:alpha-E domain-containing protein [Acidimicrobiales bacterium]